MKNKKGVSLLISNIIFILLVVVFFASMLYFVNSRAGAGISFYEQVYAKKIALMLDASKPDTTLQIDISKLYDYKKDNKYTGKIVDIDYTNKRVLVKASQNSGYIFRYFSDITIVYGPEIKKDANGQEIINEKILIIEVGK